jgi:hypothetical protein
MSRCAGFPLAGNPQVAALLRGRNLSLEVLPDNLTGQPDGVLHWLVLHAS